MGAAPTERRHTVRVPDVQPETVLVRERGDKVTTLDERLDTMEAKIERTEKRVNYLFAALGTLVVVAQIVMPILTARS